MDSIAHIFGQEITLPQVVDFLQLYATPLLIGLVSSFGLDLVKNWMKIPENLRKLAFRAFVAAACVLLTVVENLIAGQGFTSAMIPQMFVGYLVASARYEHSK